MGCNYYLLQPSCGHCGKSGDRLHIGKSSAGWVFAVHLIPERNLNCLNDWIQFIKVNTGIGWTLVDENDKPITLSDLVNTITNRSWSAPTEHDDRYSVPGPNNLSRHKLDESFCVAHGPGTWDYIVGDFS